VTSRSMFCRRALIASYCIRTFSICESTKSTSAFKLSRVADVGTAGATGTPGAMCLVDGAAAGNFG